MKIVSAFCDLHPTIRLSEGFVKIPARYEAQVALRCTLKGCGRHFHYDFGYFQLVDGSETDFGDLSVKPQCKNKHDLIFMLLTNVDGALMYACFHPECQITAPYVPGNGAT